MMKKISIAALSAAVILLSACATTPEQKAQRAEAQKRYEQNLQVSLAAQCDQETAQLMRRQFDLANQQAAISNDASAPTVQSVPTPSKATTKEEKEFRLKYVDKMADPMFQACYKMAWQNYLSQERLREMRYYYDYDDWDDFYPFRGPFRHPFFW